MVSTPHAATNDEKEPYANKKYLDKNDSRTPQLPKYLKENDIGVYKQIFILQKNGSLSQNF